jgi:tRNA(Ile)-lysidine synthase
VAALDPAVAAIRAALRSTLSTADSPARERAERPSARVLVACSGGTDSLALAAATAFVAPRLGVAAGLVTVDHQLQPGSAEQAKAVADWATGAGLAPVVVETVSVAGPGGPEAAARDARYEALVRAARDHGAGAVLLGHTRDDQAETVLLALLRGAGPRGLAAMPVRREVSGVALLRPLLDVSREQTAAACAALGLRPWHDPHNLDLAYGRVRVRGLLADLSATLGPSVAANLARTAGLVAADTAALDALADAALAAALTEDGLAAAPLADLAPAVRTRALYAWARSLGAPGAALSQRHVTALDALVVGWRGQGPVHLPAGILVRRRHGILRREPPTAAQAGIIDEAGW